MANNDSNADLSGTVRIPKKYAERTRRVLEALNSSVTAQLVGPTRVSKIIVQAMGVGLPSVLDDMEQALGISENGPQVHDAGVEPFDGTPNSDPDDDLNDSALFNR